MATAPRVLLAVCITAGTALGPALPALAAASGQATVRPAAEAWYRSTPACALPTGCVDLTGAPSPYAANTLHVGADAGTESARTYVRLDLSPVPAGTKVTGGTMLLPVASAADAGTQSPETAKLRACAVKGEVKDVDGDFATPPEADCDAASAPATFVPAEGENPAAFTVSLSAFPSAWEGGATAGAVALLPAEETAPPDTWHVAFSQRERTGEGVAPISANLAFVSASADTSFEPAPFVAPPPFEPAPTFTDNSPSFDTGSSFAAPPLTVEQPLPAPEPQAAPEPVAAPAQQQVVPASFVQGGFRYPAVFLLPLLLLAGASYIARALTRDLAEARVQV